MRNRPTEFLYGIHPVTEVFRAGRRKIYRVFKTPKARSRRIMDLLMYAKQAGVPVKTGTLTELAALAQTDQHQGVCAEVGLYPVVSLEVFCDEVGAVPTARRLLLLDHIVDPQNLGALIRTACCAAVDGIIITKDRTAALTPTVSKASAGALEHIRLARVTNMTNTIKRLQKNGFWVFGLSGDGRQSIYTSDFSGPVALVIGSEAKGLRPLVKKSCDQLMRIPQADTIDSLNASVAGGIAIYEIYRQHLAETPRDDSPYARPPKT